MQAPPGLGVSFVLVLAVLQGLPDVSSLTRVRTHRLSSEHVESSPLDHQGVSGPGVLAGKKGGVVSACPWLLPTLDTNPEERTATALLRLLTCGFGACNPLAVCRQEACGLLGSALRAPPRFLARV